ncbi:MAG: phosphoribosylformylglycinamidine cyclo-ligase [Thermoplasmata archaeon]|nr:phosphoribosylformylglycinamidine cyclo-ligase [Thermoplasmata archaeon]
MGPKRRASGWTYAKAGVDRGSIREGLAALLAEVHYRAPASSGRPLALSGHYAGVVRIGRESIAVTTDTVGTKVLLAAEMGRWGEVGEDAVAINVNDLAAIGARPAAIVDTLVMGRPDRRQLAGIGRGLERGLRAARCSLLGGETAVVPEMLAGIDIGATAIGFLPNGRRPITGARLRPGDVLLGLPSSGVHANGLTLARRIVRESRVPWRRPRRGARVALGVEMLRPTTTYVGAVEAVADSPDVTGLAHISGGGVRNLLRLNPNVSFLLDGWPGAAGVFGYLQKLGGVSNEEMYQTFNMGVGFVVAVRPRGVRALSRSLARASGTPVSVVGVVEKGTGVRLPALGLRYAQYA